MFKKLLKTMVVAVAAMSMTVTVMAAGSIVGTLDKNNVSSDKGSVSLTDKVSGDMQAVVDKVNNAQADSTVNQAFQGEASGVKVFVDNKEQDGVANLDEYKFLSPVVNMKVDGVTPSSSNPVKVTFTVNNLTDDIDVYAMVYCAEHGRWEMVKAEKISKNQVVATVHSDGPVTLVYKKAAAAKPGTDGQVTPTTAPAKPGTVTPTTAPAKPGTVTPAAKPGTVSPQTSSRTAMPMAACAAVLTILGGVALVQYKKENR